MKHTILKFCLFGVLLSLVFGCEKPVGGEDGPSNEKPGLLSGVTIDLNISKVTATTATASYSVNLGDAADMPIDVKIRYSIAESLSGPSSVVKTLDKTASSTVLTGLQFDRQYFYEVFISLYGTEYNAKKGSFTTSAISVTMAQPRETDEGLVLAGSVQGTEKADWDDLDAYVYFCESEYPEETQKRFDVQLDDASAFEVLVPNTAIDTEYGYWWAVKSVDEKSIEGEKLSYKTSNPYASSKQPSASGTDLSASGTANSYIVSQPGAYKFKMTKGNTQESVGNVSAVRILWESFGTAVSPKPFDLISATGKDGDYALFEVPQSFKEGNAVIAAYDSQEKILWSWHIWLTSDSISAETYYVSSNGVFTDEVAGVVMDRNLGALSNGVNSVDAFGLFYQWGRKDPYLGSANAAGTAFAVSTRSLRVAIVDASMQTIDYTVANPHVFLFGNSRKDWIAEKNNTLWTNSTKTKYDPCPPGWRIPDGGTGLNGVQAGLWAKIGMNAYGKTPMPASWQSGWKGMMFPISKTGYSSWYPVAGGIGLDAALKLVGVDGTYWTAAAIGGNHDYVFAMNFYFASSQTEYYAYCSTEVPRATGNSVRCCKE
ncbi:MAG: hypothetical protein IKW11_05350 [Bacteroidales bacterium]|nr:hypothetical protein [Bacteroidales bacterium]